MLVDLLLPVADGGANAVRIRLVGVLVGTATAAGGPEHGQNCDQRRIGAARLGRRIRLVLTRWIDRRVRYRCHGFQRIL